MSSGTEIISAADYRAGLAGKALKQAKAKPYPVAEPAVPGACYTFTYSGPVVSNNKTFSGMHWAKRNALTEKWHAIFHALMKGAQVQPMERFKLHLRYNSRHDVDNLVLVAKWAVDSMKGVYVTEDSKKHYRGITIEPDESLLHNTFVFVLTELI